MFTIFCIIRETTTPFSVKVPENVTVDELKQKIQETVQARAAGIDNSLIDLYLINVDASKEPDVYMQEVQRKAQDLKSLSKLDPVRPLTKVFEGGPLAEMIHVLVVPSHGE